MECRAPSLTTGTSRMQSVSLLFCQSDICPKAHTESCPQGGSGSPTSHVSASLTLFNSLILHRQRRAKNTQRSHWFFLQTPQEPDFRSLCNQLLELGKAFKWKSKFVATSQSASKLCFPYVRREILQYVSYGNVNWQVWALQVSDILVDL